MIGSTRNRDEVFAGEHRSSRAAGTAKFSAFARLAASAALLSCVLGVATLTGCSDRSNKAPARKPIPSTPPAEYDSPLAKHLFERWRERARETDGDGPVRQGKLEQGRFDDFPVVLTGIYCYKILAVGGDGVDDLGLVLFDDGNVPLLRSTERGRAPTLGIDEPICPYDPGSYRLRVESKKGSGAYALRVYRASSI